MTATIKIPKDLYIGAQWVASSSVEDVLNPATEESIGQVPVADKATVDAAIGAARDAFDNGPWPNMAMVERKVYMQKFYEALERRKEQIQAIITAEAGATVFLAQTHQYATPMRHFQYYLSIMEQPTEQSLPVWYNAGPNNTTILGAGVVMREPIGVVSAITAYNYPFLINLSKVVPALCVGCTLVLKPSPLTPFQALILGEAAEEAGLPRGVFNVVNGGSDVGEMLTSDPRVDLVTFTGSDVVGGYIQAQAAPTLKRVLLELGGKSALIVRPDANLDGAVGWGLASFTMHAGQGCALTTRHLVHNSIRKAYVEKLGAAAAALKVGNPADPATQMGPVISAAQRKKTEDYVAIALDQGARLVTGGKRPGHLPKGYFHEPTLFDDVENHYRIAQEEVFGPIAVVIGYDTDEEAIAIANKSDFGLNGAIYSADVGKAFQIARKLRTGGVHINGSGGGMNSNAPFGGIKRSGYGREYGHEGLWEYTYQKSVQFRGG